MTLEPSDPLDDLIAGALARHDDARAPVGFAERVDARVHYVRLLDQHRRQMRHAVLAAFGGLIAFAGVAGLFLGVVHVPTWAIENVPGVLGQLDAASIRAGRFATPLLLMAAGAFVAATAWGALRLRSRARA